MFPGSSVASACRLPADIDHDMNVMFREDVLTQKLVSLPAFKVAAPKGKPPYMSLHSY
jgi:hypothetical protein